MLYQFVSGDFPISITLWLLLAMLATRYPGSIRGLWRDRSRAWRWIGRLALTVPVLAPLWIAAADNWRQLLGLTMPAGQRWTSDPFETTPPADWVHAVSLGLLALAILALALLYARRRYGLWLLLVPLLVGSTYFYFMNAIRIRVDVLLRQAEYSLHHPEPYGLAFTLFWAAGLYVFIASVIVALLAALWALVAFVTTVVYNLLTRGGHPDPESLRVFEGIAALKRSRE